MKENCWANLARSSYRRSGRWKAAMPPTVSVLARAPLLVLNQKKTRTEWNFAPAEILEGQPIDAWPLRLLENKRFGRHIVAARNLKAGELVFAEDPFAQTIHDARQSTHCHLCYSALRDSQQQPVVCGDCKQVCYCSPECARGGMLAHEAECDVLSHLAASGATAALQGMRGLRLFIRLVHRSFDDPEAFKEVKLSPISHLYAPPLSSPPLLSHISPSLRLHLTVYPSLASLPGGGPH